jgi:L,D-transpeptidase catalytic domain
MWCRASVSSRFTTANRGFLWPGLTVRTQSERGSLRVRRHALAASASVLTLIVGFALASPASAKIRHEPKEPERTAKAPFGELPKGPLQIVISINQQKLHLYADGKEVAETLVATGVPSLPTPTGVFSVIQKQRFHRSNIYSGAPMPFMQRITWSGVAIHEGENIGHPASHGCIRMPHDFAVRLYDTTKVGVRVMIAREELKPVPFADPHLFVHKVAPPPAAPTPAPAPATTSAEPAPSSAAPALTAARPAAPAPVQAEATKIAQNVENKTTDATAPAKPDAQPAAKADAAPSASDSWVQAGAPTAPAASTQADAPAAAPNATAQADPPANAPAAAAEANAAAPASSADESGKPVVASDTPAVELRGSVSASTPLDQPAQAAPPPPPPVPTTLVETAPATHGPIAIFVSRKEKKIYVRQDFTPLFYAPVTFTDPGQPIGTTVFTAMDYLDDGTTFRWNVVSFPGERPKVKRVAENERRSARRGRDEEPAKATGELPSPQTPAQVLARIDIPQDVIERISELMVPGSSLVVSDQGIGDETGEGTDFIVVTRE